MYMGNLRLSLCLPFVDAALPKYMERTLREGSLYGTVLMTNPLAKMVFAWYLFQ